TGESTFPVAAPGHGFAERDLHLLALKPLIILGFDKFALDARGADLKGIAAARHDVLDVQDRAHLLGNELAVGVGDAGRVVDRDTDETVGAAALDLDLDDFHTFRLGQALCDLFDFGRYRFVHRCKCVKSNKKVGFRPLDWLDPSKHYCSRNVGGGNWNCTGTLRCERHSGAGPADSRHSTVSAGVGPAHVQFL